MGAESPQLRSAVDAMRALLPFASRIAGVLATGQPSDGAPIVLHVAADHPDLLSTHLDALGIPRRHLRGRLHIPRGTPRPIDGFAFVAGTQDFVLWVLEPSDFRQRLRVANEAADLPRIGLRAAEQRLAAGS